MFDATATDTLNKQPHEIDTWLTMVEALIKQTKKEHLEGRRHQRLEDHYQQLPSHNKRIRALTSKRTKDQSITKFLRPTNVQAKSH
jgi:hypothetical protein